MASIDFYYMRESPPCRAVEMVAELVGANLNRKHTNLSAGDHLKDEYAEVNPLKKIPFIVDNGFKLGESRAIMMYLVNKFQPTNEQLYPSEPKARALVDALLFYDIGTLYQSGSKLFYPKLLGPVKEYNAEDEKAFKASLSYLDKKLEQGGEKFLLGDHLTIADVSIAASLSCFVAFSYDLDAYKHLVAYMERLRAAIPKYSEINDKAVDNFKKYVESKQQQPSEATN